MTEVLAEGRVKAGIIKARRDWLEEHGGSLKQTFLDALTPETRALFTRPLLPTEWQPFSAIVEIDRTLKNVFGTGRSNFLADLGRQSAHMNLAGPYRAFTRESIHDFFRNAALLNRQFQDFGTITYEQTGPTSGRMVHSDYTSFSPIFCESALGYYEGCVAVHGGDRAIAVETKCQAKGDESCTFELTWR